MIINQNPNSWSRSSSGLCSWTFAFFNLHKYLNKAIKYCITHHFADHTNLLVVNKSIQKLQKQVNLDLKYLCKWLKANKISLNASKTEILIWRHPCKPVNYNLKLKIDGKKIIPSFFIKYLGILIDCHLNWHFQVNNLSAKLARAIGMLKKICHYVKFDTLRMIYYGIFSSILLLWFPNMETK